MPHVADFFFHTLTIDATAFHRLSGATPRERRANRPNFDAAECGRDGDARRGLIEMARDCVPRYFERWQRRIRTHLPPAFAAAIDVPAAGRGGRLAARGPLDDGATTTTDHDGRDASIGRGGRGAWAFGRCAVVGSSASLMTRRRGHEIDAAGTPAAGPRSRHGSGLIVRCG